MDKPFNHLLSDLVQSFIKDHEKDDEKILVLKHKEIHGIPSAFIAQQIAGRRKAKSKLPQFYNTKNIVYPPQINMEQCSSEKTAQFKASIISGKLAADLTGGFGVDSYFLSKKFTNVFYIEPDEQLAEIAKHNHSTLAAQNIHYEICNAESFIYSAVDYFDLIYIDPSRRNSALKKVFRFSDCSPDITQLLPVLTKKTDSLLIKASPLMDIKQGLNELGFVNKVYVVGFDNECKEILFFIREQPVDAIIEVIDLSEENEKKVTFTYSEESQSEITYSDPREFLYEPSAMMLKAGAFKLITKRYSLAKLSPNTHLYTADRVVENFPGRIFKVEDFIKSDRKSVLKVLPEGCANVISRNYPLSPDQLKKKLGIKDGGVHFIIAFSGQDKKFLALTKRVK